MRMNLMELRTSEECFGPRSMFKLEAINKPQRKMKLSPGPGLHQQDSCKEECTPEVFNTETENLRESLKKRTQGSVGPLGAFTTISEAALLPKAASLFWPRERRSPVAVGLIIGQSWTELRPLPEIPLDLIGQVKFHCELCMFDLFTVSRSEQYFMFCVQHHESNQLLQLSCKLHGGGAERE